jgi:DNA-binding SARP family transcriptional activator
MMEFRVLGALEACDGGTVVDLGPPRVRVVCGILLVRPGELVAVEQFIDELWPERPPPDARALVREYVSRLRRALRSGPNKADLLVTRKPGYLLRIQDYELDLHRFEELVAEARAARQVGQSQHAVELFRRAHELWRGEPFADVPRTASIAAMSTSLTEQRLTTMEERFDVSLAAGQHADIATELTDFVAAHPLRERPAGQLMITLYRCGRQAEALERYQLTRRILADEIGVDPGPELRQLHQRILDADPTLHAPFSTTEAGGSVPAATPAPQQLPRDLSTFVGRDRELANLRALLETDDTAHSGPVMVIHGAAGVGKSALAVRAAHLWAARFADGQLHVDLCGFTVGVEPLSAAEGLRRLLRGLGVASTDIPSNADEAAGVFRTVVAQRRLLIVLDNAATAAQVRPLLPGSPGSAVLITSRMSLTVLESATHVRLGPLSADEAHAMLAALVRDVRPAAEPDATRRLADLCDHLPLGLHVAAARLNTRPSWAMRDLVDRLTDERHRLTELTAGDIALRTSLIVSYAALSGSDNHTDQAAALALRLFGLLPVTTIDRHLAAAVFNTSHQDTDRIVERLLDAHLVEETTSGHFHMHDLTRLVAHEFGTNTLPPDERHAALTRALSHYLATVQRANTLAYPHRTHHPVPKVDTPPTPLAGHEDALRWLDDHRRNMTAVVQQALHGTPEQARLGVGVAIALHWHYVAGAADMHDITLYEDVLAAAMALDDRRAQAGAHAGLGMRLNLAGQPDEACAHHTSELAICRELGDRFGEQRALGSLAGTHVIRGAPDVAIPYLQQQLELARAIGAPIGQAYALITLGKAHHQLGHFTEAIDYIETALAWYEKPGDHLKQCDAHELLARVHIDLGHYDHAIALATRGLDQAHHIGYRYGEIWALIILAQAHRLSGNTDKARHHAQQAVTISHHLHGAQARTDALTEYAQLPT